MSDRLIKHFWQQDERECVLYSVDGVLELRLIDARSEVQRVPCRDMKDAATKAFDLARYRPEFESR
jgi:hypothetical protein